MFYPPSNADRRPCEQQGQCNGQTGTCQCAIGYEGVDCTTPIAQEDQLEPPGQPFWMTVRSKIPPRRPLALGLLSAFPSPDGLSDAFQLVVLEDPYKA